MSEPKTTALRYVREGSRLVVTLDDPATRNAMTDALVGDLFAVAEWAAADRSLRTLIIQGNNGSFCAGADLKGAKQNLSKADAEDPVREGNRRGGRLFSAINSQPQTVIAIVDGPAFGGGFGLTCCADVVITGPRARFSLSETTLGLPPAQIAPYVVARLGMRMARRLAMTGTRFDGKKAVEYGLSDFHGETQEQIDAILKDVLNDIGRCAPGALAITKKLVQSFMPIPDAYIDQAADAFAECLTGEEGREGVTAFNEKRPARWVEKL
jgi:isohexenylglutaconyl-CoA hydratase